MKRFMFIAVSVISALYLPAVINAQETQKAYTPDQIDSTRAITSREELLLFYEEKDLVVATRRRTSLKKAPAIATVITAGEIRNMGARNIMDVLKSLSSIGIAIDEFGRHMVEVRGIRTTTSEKILLMIDGHSLNEPYTGGAFANLYIDLPVENIKQVEVMRGPGSALYGANAFLAVINVVTKDAEDPKGTLVTLGGGSFNTKRANVLSGVSDNGLHFLGSIDYFSTDGPRLLVENDRPAAFPILNNSTAPGTTDQYMEKTDVFLKALYGSWSFRGQYVGKKRGAYIGFFHSLTDENTLRYDNFWNELAYHKEINDKLSFKVRAYMDQFELGSRFELLPEGSVIYTSLTNSFFFPDGMSTKTELTNRTLGSELQLERRLFQGNRLTFGVLLEKIKQSDVRLYANFHPLNNSPLGSFQDVSALGNFNKAAERDVFAVFAQDEWELNKNLNLTAGARYDRYSDFGGTFNPRFGLVYGFTARGDMKLLYGRAFRAPNFKELYDQNNSFSLGNPDLKPETIDTYEASVGYALMQSLHFEANYFYSEIDNLIDRDTRPTPPMWINKGRAVVNGAGVKLSGRYSSTNYWRVNYTYQHGEDSETNRRLPYVPSNRATAGINHVFSRRLNANMEILWTGERSRPEGDPRPPVAPHTLVDLTLIDKGISENIEIRGSIHNLFDRRYKDPDTSVGLIPDDFPREGMSALVEATYRF